MARARLPAALGHDRARLHRLLDDVWVARLALVTAPAGSGKTTLLARWAQQQSAVVAWYRADAGDGHWLARCLAVAVRIGCALRLPADHPSLHATPESVDELVGVLETIDEPVVLVIDDLHELDGTPAVNDLEQLVLLAPPNLALVLGSRTAPRLNLARSELAGPVVIDGDDLRFRSWEVEEMFRDFHREPLRPEDAAALARHTAGWAAALQLFHLATRGGAPAQRSSAVRSLTGPFRYAKEYLSAQVLAGLPDELRELLTRTCVFDVVTADRCERLLGFAGAQDALDELARRQALTTTDDGGLSFRYHEVLRRYLEAALHEELGEAPARAWYCRAADILESDGAVVEAVRARCRAADWAGVRRLLHDDGERLAEDPTAGWDELLPAWLGRDDPWVVLAQARRLLDDGQLAAAVRAARHADSQFGSAAGREQCRAVIRTANAWLRGPHEVDARWADLLRAALHRNPAQHARRARDLPGAAATVVAGVALALAGEHSAARNTLRPAAERLDDDPRAAIAARIALAALSAFDVDRDRAGRELDLACAAAERRGYGWLARISRGLALVANGDVDGFAAAEQFAADCAHHDDPWSALLVSGWLQLTAARCGRADADSLDGFITACRRLQAGVPEAWARCVRALVLVTGEQPDAEAEARAAESFARAAGATGAVAISHLALAIARGADAAELQSLTAATSTLTGLELSTWLPGPRAGPAGEATTSAAPGNAVPVAGAHAQAAAPAASPDSASGAAAAPPARADSPSGAAQPVELTCFGPFRLRIGGVDQALAGARPRARALLRLLAVHAGRPVHRERLADALWGDLDAEAALHNLHVTLSSLRRSLHPVDASPAVLIERDGDAYRLVLDDRSRSDVREFEQQLAAAESARTSGDEPGRRIALERALALYSGDLLPEDGAAEWVSELRDQYRLLAAAAAAEVADLQLRAGNAALAATTAGRGVHVDRYHDGCWRALIAALQAKGDVAAAERAQRNYRDVLDSLGVPAGGALLRQG
jgi:DNA-binding SARP family transcriptional activator